MHNAPFNRNGPSVSAPSAPQPADGVSADPAPDQLASFLGRLDSVGDGLTILSEVLDALRGDRVPPAPRPPLPAARIDAPAPDHRRVLQDHQELFSLLRRIAQREIQEPQRPVASARAVTQPGPAQPTAAPAGLFLGKLDVPPVHPQYLRQARR